MAQYENSKYKIMRLAGMPPLVFGETYVVVVGINTMGPYYIGEYHILSKRPEPLLESLSWRYEQEDMPDDLLTVDLDFMIEESIFLAKYRIEERLSIRADELNTDSIRAERIILEECDARPFVGCRLRNDFNQEFIKLTQATQCKPLSDYLKLVRQIRPVSF